MLVISSTIFCMSAAVTVAAWSVWFSSASFLALVNLETWSR